MTLAGQHARFDDRFQRGSRVTLIGLSISAALAGIKIASGVVGHTYALVADGVESLLDVFGSAIVWGSLRIASRPPDEKHPYGHGRAETLGALVIASALVAAALGIGALSIKEIVTPHRVPAPFTLGILVGVVVVKEVLFRFLRREAHNIGSRAVETDAWHHRSDALTSVAAFIGISIGVWKGEGYASADDWAALFACVVILFNGVWLFRTAFDDAMDAAPPADVEAAVRQTALDVPGVVATHKCRVRRSGLGLFIDLDIRVNGSMSVTDGHAVAHAVKAALLASPLGVLDVLVHVEPADGLVMRREVRT